MAILGVKNTKQKLNFMKNCKVWRNHFGLGKNFGSIRTFERGKKSWGNLITENRGVGD